MFHIPISALGQLAGCAARKRCWPARALSIPGRLQQGSGAAVLSYFPHPQPPALKGLQLQHPRFLLARDSWRPEAAVLSFGGEGPGRGGWGGASGGKRSKVGKGDEILPVPPQGLAPCALPSSLPASPKAQAAIVQILPPKSPPASKNTSDNLV